MQFTPEPLKCHNCGSTDVTISPPWYHCNHCGATHPLPPEHAQYETLKRSFKKRYVAILLLLALLAIVMGVLYVQSSKHPSAPSEKKKITTPNTTQFPNMVFERKQLKDIDLFQQTPQGNYLLAGLDRSQVMQLYLLSKEGKALWHRTLGLGYYIKATTTPNGTHIIVHNHGENGKVMAIDQNGKVTFEKIRLLQALAYSDNGFIGVNDGTIYAFDNQGVEAWRKVINKQKITRKSGSTRDPKTGKMFSFSRTINRLRYQHITRLKDGNFVTVGKHDGDIAVTLFNAQGDILQDERYDLGRTFINAVIATKDGGFAVLANGPYHFYKFDNLGNVLFKSKLMPIERHIYNLSLIETDDGYLTTSTIGKNAKMQLVHIDKKGNKLGKYMYEKKGVRLHPKFLVKAPQEGYLLAVTTEIFEPWIIQVTPTGVIKADLDDPTKYHHPSLSVNHVKPKPSTNDQLPSHTPIEVSSAAPLKHITIKTSHFLGDSFSKLLLSQDQKYIFATTLATGFKIFEKQTSGEWKSVGNILRTRSKLIIKPHYIGPIDRKPPKRGTPYDYDMPFDIWVNRAESRAYISDINHGFYCVDITDKSHPQVRYSAPKLQLHAFVLSADEKEILFYAQGLLQRLSLEQIRKHGEDISIRDRDKGENIVALDNRSKIVVADQTFLRLYESDTAALIQQHNIGFGSYINRLISDDKEHIAVQIGSNDIQILSLDDNNLFQYHTTIYTQGRINDILLLPTHKQLCTADKKGILCHSYLDPLNPKPLVRYRNKALNSADIILSTPSAEELIIGFNPEAIGEAPVVNP